MTDTMRVFYSNDPAYEIGVSVRFWVTDLGRIFKADDIARHEAWLRGDEPHLSAYGPLGHGRSSFDGGWQMLKPEETRRCSGCHDAYVPTALTPGELRYCVGCTIKWSPCRVCGQTRLHLPHTAEQWEALNEAKV